MSIHILPDVKNSRFGMSVKAHIIDSKHTESPNIEDALYVIGFVDSFPPNTRHDKKIILKNYEGIRPIPVGANVFEAATMTRVNGPKQFLCDFLRDASKPSFGERLIV